MAMGHGCSRYRSPLPTTMDRSPAATAGDEAVPYEYDQHVYKTVSSWHASLLASVCETAKEELTADPGAETRLIYSYRNVVNGFCARVTREEVFKMARTDWFVKAIPEKTYKLMTTHTPQMIGLTGPMFHGG
ncbi:hypothetical protein ABZP36_031621, partial [Zizania latifolia]